MIKETTTHLCIRCQSLNIFKNGQNKSGNSQFRCKDCGCSSVLKPKIKYSEEQQESTINSYLEQGNLRGIQRLFWTLPKLLGDKLSSRNFDNQVNEIHARIAILNKFTELGLFHTQVSLKFE